MAHLRHSRAFAGGIYIHDDTPLVDRKGSLGWRVVLRELAITSAHRFEFVRHVRSQFVPWSIQRYKVSALKEENFGGKISRHKLALYYNLNIFTFQ